MSMSMRRPVLCFLRRYLGVLVLIANFSVVLLISVAIGCLLAPFWLVCAWHILLCVCGFRFAIRASIFPGSLLFWKSSVEHSFKLQISHDLSNEIQQVTDVVEFIRASSVDKRPSDYKRRRNPSLQDATNLSLIEAARAFIELQNVSRSIAGATATGYSQNSPEYAGDPISDESAGLNDATSTVTLPLPITRKPYAHLTQHPLVIISSTLLKAVIGNLVPFRKRSCGMCRYAQRFFPSSFSVTNVSSQLLKYEVDKVCKALENCQVVVPKRFGFSHGQSMSRQQSRRPSHRYSDAMDDQSCFQNVASSSDDLYVHQADGRSESLYGEAVHICSLEHLLKKVYARHSKWLRHKGEGCATSSERHFMTEDVPDQLLLRALRFCTGFHHSCSETLFTDVPPPNIHQHESSDRCPFNQQKSSPKLLHCSESVVGHSVYVTSGVCTDSPSHLLEKPAGEAAPSNSLSNIEILLEHLRHLGEMLESMQMEKPWSLRGCTSMISEFLIEPPLGSLTHLRNRLELHHCGLQFWISVRDGTRIDAMFLPRGSNKTKAALRAISSKLYNVSYTTTDTNPGIEINPMAAQKDLMHLLEGCAHFDTEEDCSLKAHSFQSSESSTAPSQSEWLWGPVVVFCNPNACFYETTIYYDDWLNFYLRRNVNLVIFNYRGFGRSEGSPNPKSIANDTEDIVSHLISISENRRPFDNKSTSSAALPTKNSQSTTSNTATEPNGDFYIGVHGRSVGGIGAIHAAWKFPNHVKWLCADRTFQTLEAAAFHLIGSWSSIALRLGLCTADNVKKFMFCSAYKVICWDPEDQVIQNAASLKSGVCKALKTKQRSSQLSLHRTLRYDLLSNVELTEIQRCSQTADDQLLEFDCAFLKEVVLGLDVIRALVLVTDESERESEDLEFVDTILKKIFREGVYVNQLRIELQGVRQVLIESESAFSIFFSLKELEILVFHDFTSCGLTLEALMLQIQHADILQRVEALDVFITSFQLWGSYATHFSTHDFKKGHLQQFASNQILETQFLTKAKLPSKLLSTIYNGEKDTTNELRPDYQFLNFARLEAHRHIRDLTQSLTHQIHILISSFNQTTNNNHHSSTDTRTVTTTSARSSTSTDTSMKKVFHPSASDVEANCMHKMNSSNDNHQVFNDLNQVVKYLEVIEKFFFMLDSFCRQRDPLTKKEDSDYLPTSMIRDANQSSPSYGFLVPLSCGHNGCLSRSENESLHFHFQFSKIWNTPNNNPV